METEGFEVYNDPDFKRFLANFTRASFTTEEEEQRLGAQLKQGGKAREDATKRLVESHLCLVVSIASRFRGQGVSLQDLIQEGTFGLYDACRKFDPEKAAFRTYAFAWVWQRIKDYVASHSRTVRLPTSLVRKGIKMARQIRNGGRLPDAEMAALLGTKPKHLKRLETVMQGEVSLDAPLTHDSDTTFGDTIEAPDTLEAAETAMDTAELVTAVRKAMASLNAREMDVIRGRFAMDGEDVESLEELAARHGVSRERIRQIQVRAMEKLKEGPHGKVLERFLSR